jgi:AcrR family transcriptional regulator
MREQKDGRSTDTRERILQEAARLYFRGNYEAVSMQVIADHLHISKTAIFHHFKNKQELFFEMWLMSIERFQNSLKDAVEQQEPQSTRAKLRRIMQCFIREPGMNISRLAQDVRSFLSPQQQEDLRQRWRSSLAIARQVLVEGIERGELRPHHTQLTTYVLLQLGTLLPQFGNAREFLPTLSQDEYIDALLNMLLDGLSAS